MKDNALPVGIVVVDDHPAIREICTIYINACETCHVLGEAGTGNEALELVEQLQPDDILLDIRLPRPGPDGIRVAQIIKADHPSTKIVIFSAFPQSAYVRRLLEIGVNGYMTKDSPMEEVIEAVHIAHRGGAMYSPEINKVLANHPTFMDSQSVGSDLTQRELDVLQSLASGLENRDIAYHLAISSSSVQLHLTSIFGKLQASNRTDAVILAAKSGLVVFEE